MIKTLKLQKALIILLLGVVALVVYTVMYMKEMENSMFALEVAGVSFMVGALLMLYPILFSKKDKEGAIQLDSEKHDLEEKEEIKTS